LIIKLYIYKDIAEKYYAECMQAYIRTHNFFCI